MKVEIENIKEEASFVPYKVTFIISTREDSTKFHDKVAINIAGCTSKLVGEIYKRSTSGRFDNIYTTEID